jgi:hypothetical protein
MFEFVGFKAIYVPTPPAMPLEQSCFLTNFCGSNGISGRTLARALAPLMRRSSNPECPRSPGKNHLEHCRLCYFNIVLILVIIFTFSQVNLLSCEVNLLILVPMSVLVTHIILFPPTVPFSWLNRRTSSCNKFSHAHSCEGATWLFQMFVGLQNPSL